MSTKLPSDEALACVFAASLSVTSSRDDVTSLASQRIATEDMTAFVQVYQELHKQADEQAAAVRRKENAVHALLAAEPSQINTLEERAFRLRDDLQAKHGSRGLKAGTPAVEFLAACNFLARFPKETE